MRQLTKTSDAEQIVIRLMFAMMGTLTDASGRDKCRVCGCCPCTLRICIVDVARSSSTSLALGREGRLTLHRAFLALIYG